VVLQGMVLLANHAERIQAGDAVLVAAADDGVVVVKADGAVGAIDGHNGLQTLLGDDPVESRGADGFEGGLRGIGEHCSEVVPGWGLNEESGLKFVTHGLMFLVMIGDFVESGGITGGRVWWVMGGGLRLLFMMDSWVGVSVKLRGWMRAEVRSKAIWSGVCW
jgi:hypothetical protein